MSDTFGVVLAGGRSLRMGEDKARLCVGGRPLLLWAVTALQAVVPRVYCSGGDRSLAHSLGASYIADTVGGRGPLGGIESAMRTLGGDLLVLGCDMPLVHPALLRLLIGRCGGADAVVSVKDGMYEPLLAMYRYTCLDAIEGALAAGKRRVASFYPDVRVRLLDEHAWRAVDPEGMSFLNVNTPTDLEAVRSAVEGECDRWARPVASATTS